MSYKLAACADNDYIYTSDNSGVSWTAQTNSTIQSWSCIASSSDGSKLAACVNGGYIYTSNNSGNSWILQTSSSSQLWSSIASSADGSKLAACVNGGYIYTSNNSGHSWTAQTSSTIQTWSSIASSSDGIKLAACVNSGYIYTSNNSGNNWIAQTSYSSQLWSSIASSSDGIKLAACVNGGNIWTSTDSGSSWTERVVGEILLVISWQSITSSSDGSKLAALGDYIYTSSDSGNNWTKQTQPIGLFPYNKIISSSSDGSFLAGFFQIVYPVLTDYIYTSSDSGVNWIPQINSGSKVWTGITISSPTVCLIGTTGILMADSSYKNIKDIQRGERVMTNKETGEYKKVCRVVRSLFAGTVINIPKGLLENSKDIIVTEGHPIWINSDKNRIYSKNIIGVEKVQKNELFYNIQFEEEGVYYAENVKMDSLSPNNLFFKLPKNLYFNKKKHNKTLLIKDEDDPKRNKPNMLEFY